MKSLWNDRVAQNFTTDLALRVYTSNLLGQSDELVLHGGGNTSVKTEVDGEEVLYVKGSGWDLVSIKEEGFAPVKLSVLQEMAKLSYLSDTDMVKQQKEAMIDSHAPNPSVEAILHAIIPFKFVDHTHADAIVTISNSHDGRIHIKQQFPNFLIVPYVMPGFILAQKIYEMTQWYDWEHCEGIILHNHGIFTFDNDAKRSYEKMIQAVSNAEQFLDAETYGLEFLSGEVNIGFDVQKLQTLISKEKGFDVMMKINQTPLVVAYSSFVDLETFATRGVLTPEHIIRTKRIPLVLNNDNEIGKKILEYITDYKNYFNQFSTNEIMLNPTPNYVIIKEFGMIVFGRSEKEVTIMNDIIEHTILAVLRADRLGGYESISIEESFKMEYWELEQNKIKKDRL